MSKQRHLTIDEKIVIETELRKRSSFKSIGTLIGKDCTTISKEIRAHRTSEKTGAFGKDFNDCLYDFRHYFACASIMKWLDEGKDIE